MVDFNNEMTVSTPATDIVKVLILQRRNDVFDAYELWQKQEEEGISGNGKALVFARIKTLFLELQPMLKRKKKKEEYGRLTADINNKDKVVDNIYLLNEFVDDLKITRIDSRKIYDSSIAELQNKEKGL